MNLRILALIAACLPALAVATAGTAEPTYSNCKTLANGITACGEVADGFCGAGSGSGQATGVVNWKLAVYTNHGNAYDEETGVAAALAATAPCWTDTCTTVALYANDELIVSSMTICL